MSNFSESSFAQLIGFTGYAIETVGVIVIIAGSVWAMVRFFREFAGERDENLYRELRREIGRAMMLGLEFLIAGDIIRTVVIAHAISDVLSLGLLVLIRTVLVFTIHLEVEGQWPWQQKAP